MGKGSPKEGRDKTKSHIDEASKAQADALKRMSEAAKANTQSQEIIEDIPAEERQQQIDQLKQYQDANKRRIEEANKLKAEEIKEKQEIEADKQRQESAAKRKEKEDKWNKRTS